MSLYVLEGINDSLYVAMGEQLAESPLRFTYENQMPVAYVASQMGLTVESQPAVVRVKVGEFIDTSKGDFIVVKHTHTTQNGEVLNEETVQVDVGEGINHLQSVVPLTQQTASVDDLGPPPDFPFYSESAITTNPFESQQVEYYVPPEAPTPEPTFIASGSPVTYSSGGQTYTYTASGTSSATQDLIQYGELDINGNPIQTYDPYLQANLAAAYDGV